MSIKVKRGLAINLPTLEEGELGFTTDSYEMYVGSDNGNILLNNGEILIRRNNGMLQYAQSSRKNQWFDICSLEEIRGDQGVQGIQGIQGVKGDKGDKGERGIQGEKGNPFTYADFTPDQLRALKGEKGDTGAKGERGLTGDKGDRGIGLNYAWSGTRLGVKRDTDAQYTYVDLKGADGKDGKDGEQGERGERGIQGEKGDTPSIAHLEQQVSDKSKELDTKFNTLTAKQQQDAEVVTARDGEVSLNARLERDLAKGKIHFVDVEGSNISTESEEGYLENVEIHGNTWQNANNLSDIRSVGTKVEGQELYEIPVLSTGKNLLNINSLGTYYGVTFSFEKNVLSVKGTGTVSILKKHSIKHLVEEGRTYVLTSKSKNSNVGIIDGSSVTSIGGAFVAGNDVCIYFQIREGVVVNETIELQLEEGTQATPYEPYQEDKLTILSPTPLEKVGDVADRIICKDGVWGVEKNVDNIVFNGSEQWNYNSTTKEFYLAKSNYIYSGSYGCISDKFVYGETAGSYNNVIKLGNAIFVTLRKDDITNINDFKAWLQNNNVLVMFITPQPQFIPLPHAQQIKLRTFADITNIHFETEIEGIIKAQAPKSLGATVNTHTSQIDNLNKELDRVKKLEESTISTVTSDKAFTTIAETTQGYFEDAKLEGKTLVNLMGTYRKSGTIPYKYATLGQSVHNLTAGNTYTLITTTNKRYDLKYLTTNEVIRSNQKLNELIVFSFVAKYSELVGMIVLDSEGEYQSDIILLEGDHTDKDLNFFEGLKSVGQDSNEISVSSVNENLLMPFYTGSPVGFSNLNAISFNSDHSISYTATAWGQGIKVHVSGVSKGEKYLLLLDSNLNGCIRGYGGLATGGDVSCYNNKIEITAVSSGDAYIVFKNTTEVCNVSFTNARLVKKSSIDTNYKLHKQDKKQILYYNPTAQTWEKPVLREWDSIEKHSDGKYYYHKRSEEVVLNGSESGLQFSTHTDNCCRFMLCRVSPSVKLNQIAICDRFSTRVYNSSIDIPGVTIGGSNDIHIYIDKSMLSTPDLPGFKAWLQANPTTVVYQLAQEEVYECTNLDLITYPNETNLIVNSGAIQPKLTLKVLSNVSNVVKLLQEKVSVLENKFIEGLKQVLAGDMMSLAHMLYPEDFALENDTPQVIPYIEEGDINE